MELHTLSVEITKYTQYQNITFFLISIYHSTSKSSWTVNRRFSDFEALQNSLNKQFLEVPALPSKAFWKKFSSTFLEDRKSQLNVFLSEVINRSDFLKTTEVVEFLEVHQNVQGFKVNSIDEISHQQHRLIPNSIVSIDLEHCLLALNGGNIEKNLKLSLVESTESCVICQKINIETLWVLPVPLNITCLAYSKELTILCIGLENGGISAYRIKSEISYKEYEEFTFLYPHSLNVTGIVIDYRTSDIFTCSNDRKIKKLNLQQETVLKEASLDSFPMDLQADLQKQQVFIASSKSGVVVFDSSTLAPISAVPANKIKKICLTEAGVFFVGLSKGGVNVFKDSVLVTNLLVNGKVNCLKYSFIRKEVVVGNQNGFISVWSKTGKLLRTWKGHDKGVVSIEISGNILMTGGLDGNVVIWQLPVFWVDPEFERIEMIESEIQAKTVRVMRTQKNIKELDDLKGWHKH